MRGWRKLLAGSAALLTLGAVGTAASQTPATDASPDVKPPAASATAAPISGTANPGLAPARPEEAVALGEALRLVEAWLDGQRAYQRIPGLSAGVVVKEKLAWAKGFGTIDAARKVPATPKTLYSICSISKLFTSIALMQQWEAGKVRLDEPLTTYLPWATPRQTEPDSLPITLRAMLSHASGLPREAADSPYWSGPGYVFPTREEIRRKLAEQSTLFGADRWYQYSNLGLTLVGETVEAVSGRPYAQYMQAEVLGPLGLTQTRPRLPLELLGRQFSVAWGPLKRDGSRDRLPTFDPRGVTPAAGFSSNVEDLGRFAAWQMRLLRTGRAEVLKASTLREMQRVQFTDPDWETTWGLGFAVSHVGEETFVGHGGSCPGYRTSIRLHPKSETAVVLMLNTPDQPGPLVAGMFAILKKRADYKFKPPPPAALGVRLEDYAGRYDEEPWASESVVLPWAGGLAILELPTTDPAKEVAFLKPKGGDLFRRVRDDGSEAEEVRFERDAKGRVVRYVWHSNPKPRVGPAPAPVTPPLT